jgi:hypothetical protein
MRFGEGGLIRHSGRWHPERRSVTDGYLFLSETCLLSTAAFFFAATLLALACFCPAFFCVDFGDLSPITLIRFCRLTCLRHVSFSVGGIIILGEAPVVNGSR